MTTLIDAVKHGQMKPLSVWEGGRGITGWVFEKTSLKTWLASLSGGNSTWMTIPQVATTLAIKDEVAYWLCQNGYLYAEKLGSGSASCVKELGSRVRVEEVKRFREAYVLGRDIAGGLCTSSHCVGRLFAEEGIFPIRGYSTRPPRMQIYLLTDGLRRFLADLMGVRPSELQLGPKMNPIESGAETSRIILSDEKF